MHNLLFRVAQKCAILEKSLNISHPRVDLNNSSEIYNLHIATNYHEAENAVNDDVHNKNAMGVRFFPYQLDGHLVSFLIGLCNLTSFVIITAKIVAHIP